MKGTLKNVNNSLSKALKLLREVNIESEQLDEAYNEIESANSEVEMLIDWS